LVLWEMCECGSGRVGGGGDFGNKVLRGHNEKEKSPCVWVEEEEGREGPA